MSDRTEEAARGRARLLNHLRWLFLVVALGFAAWGFRANREEILAALGSIGWQQIAISTVMVFCGLAVTGVIWGRVLRMYGHRIPVAESAAIFFVGQVGKYIPGSVWSLAAQADMAKARAIPPRTTVAVGLVFLWIHLVSALPVAALFVNVPVANPVVDVSVRVVGALVGLTLLIPAVLSNIGRFLAGSRSPLAVAWSDSTFFAAAMAAVWSLYGIAAYLVVPPSAQAGAGTAAQTLLTVCGAFALSFVIGVLFIVAPAGLGAREASLIALTAPVTGVPAAAAMALVVRLIHTFCDFSIAGATWLWARSGRRDTNEGVSQRDDGWDNRP